MKTINQIPVFTAALLWAVTSASAFADELVVSTGDEIVISTGEVVPLQTRTMAREHAELNLQTPTGDAEQSRIRLQSRIMEENQMLNQNVYMNNIQAVDGTTGDALYTHENMRQYQNNVSSSVQTSAGADAMNRYMQGNPGTGVMNTQNSNMGTRGSAGGGGRR